MNIAFYIDEMNYRGIANQTFKLALSNKKFYEINLLSSITKSILEIKMMLLKNLKITFLLLEYRILKK